MRPTGVAFELEVTRSRNAARLTSLATAIPAVGLALAAWQVAVGPTLLVDGPAALHGGIAALAAAAAGLLAWRSARALRGAAAGSRDGSGGGSVCGDRDGSVCGERDGSVIGDRDGSVCGERDGSVDGSVAGSVDGSVAGASAGAGAGADAVAWQPASSRPRPAPRPSRDGFPDGTVLVVDAAGAPSLRLPEVVPAVPRSLRFCCVLPGLILLVLAPSPGNPPGAWRRPATLLLGRDTMSAESWRRLNVWLRWMERGRHDAPATRSEPT